jgi:hypothetical protein
MKIDSDINPLNFLIELEGDAYLFYDIRESNLTPTPHENFCHDCIVGALPINNYGIIHCPNCDMCILRETCLTAASSGSLKDIKLVLSHGADILIREKVLLYYVFVSYYTLLIYITCVYIDWYT